MKSPLQLVKGFPHVITLLSSKRGDEKQLKPYGKGLMSLSSRGFFSFAIYGAAIQGSHLVPR